MKNKGEKRLVYLATPDFSVPALAALVENGYKIVSVVSQPNKAQGRKQLIMDTPVAAYAKANSLPLFQPESINSPEAVAYLQDLQPDLIITAAYGQILRSQVLNLPRLGCMNIHASLLPRYRGAAPINAAIIDGEKKTGITLMAMDEGCDTGDILYQAELTIDPEDTAGSLFSKLADLGASSIIKFLPDFFTGNFTRVKQDETSATKAPKMTRETGLVNWDEGVDKLDCLIRGCQPWPGSYSFFQGQRLKIYSAKPLPERKSDLPPGSIVDCHKGLTISCGQGCLLLQEIQFASGKRMDSSVCSHNFSVGQKLGN